MSEIVGSLRREIESLRGAGRVSFTIGGLVSLAFGLGGTSLIWGPVAASIVWGLGFSAILTLFVIPLGYWWLMPEHRLRRAD